MSPLATWIATIFVIVALCIGVFLLNNFLDWLQEERAKKKTLARIRELGKWRHTPPSDLDFQDRNHPYKGDGRWH